MDLTQNLKAEFNGRIAFRERRPGIIQVLAPLFHEDGDMIDVFIDLPTSENQRVRLSDHGMTLMRLSYSYEIDTPPRRKILDRILSENGVLEDRGRLFIETTPVHLYPTLLQFAQTIAKVSNMQSFKREVIQSLFYDTLDDYVRNNLIRYHPTAHYLPIPSRDDLEVDWRLKTQPRDIFLYGVKDNSKARLAALTCREFQISKISFRSVIVHEDFENGLSKKDQARITSAADKQFTSLQDFQANAEQFFSREADPVEIQ
ncbi:MAG: DUF1828 domain-containing protein [Acidobacteriota bacterium]|nr:DUF1828 domain-containing protein [Acidobacteriota bacterium]